MSVFASRYVCVCVSNAMTSNFVILCIFLRVVVVVVVVVFAFARWAIYWLLAAGRACAAAARFSWSARRVERVCGC